MGDMQHDIEAARSGGVHSCAVLTGYNRLEQLRQSEPDVIVEHLRELWEMLERNKMEWHPSTNGSNGGHPIVTVGALIMNSFREVADTLTVRGTVGQQLDAQQSLVKAVEKTYRLSTSRYDKGIDSYLNVLDAQRSLYAAQQGLVSLRLAKLANQVSLYAVLGGGWETESQSNGPDSLASASVKPKNN